jgi:hypothetical protein
MSLAAQPKVSLRPPPLLDLRPLWPVLFTPGLDEGEPLSHILTFAIRWDHPPILHLLMMMAQ